LGLHAAEAPSAALCLPHHLADHCIASPDHCNATGGGIVLNVQRTVKQLINVAGSTSRILDMHNSTG
jgi:hypothetical protein